MQQKVPKNQDPLYTLQVDYLENYSSGMPHYHAHNSYEISLVLAGNMRILLENSVHQDSGPCLILTPPHAPHCIMHDPAVLYKRLNITFADDTFVRQYIPEGEQLLAVFGGKGRVIPLADSQLEELYLVARAIQSEADPLHQRLLLLVYLSKITQLAGVQTQTTPPPDYITGALAHLHSHYAQKIVAEALAWQLGVGRTTLLTGFKQYTGTTFGEYLTRFRLQQALRLLRQGQTQQATAEQCGFSDAGGLIRAFRRYFGTTPRKYLQNAPGPGVEDLRF